MSSRYAAPGCTGHYDEGNGTFYCRDDKNACTHRRGREGSGGTQTEAIAMFGAAEKESPPNAE